MKIYKGEKIPEKSWGLSLSDESDAVWLQAVDIVTGRFLCNLILFHNDGVINTCPKAKESLGKKFYNPYEHGNDFDKHGRIILA